MEDIKFLTWEELQSLHDDRLRKYGGQQGFIDENVVRSAMSRAQFTAQYNPDADLADLAADYMFGLSTTQGFVDGNKRAAVTAALYFLRKNGWDLVINERILYIVAMAVARNELGRDELAEEIRDHLIPVEEQG